MENPMINTVPENVVKAKEAIEAVITEYKVALVPLIIHQGDQTFSSVDIVSVAEQQTAQVQSPIITPA